jgi:hypothetical protein
VAQPATSNAFCARYDVPAGTRLFGPYQDKLANDRDTVTLFKPDPPQLPPHPDAGLVPQIVVERIRYTDASPWPTNADGWGQSLQRMAAAAYGNEPLNWQAAAPTPGRANSPTPADGDGDGMPDAWELQYFETLARDGSGDLDDDGLTDLGEYLAGTDPTLAISSLKLEIELVTGPTCSLRFDAVAGKTYTLQACTSLGSGAWQKLADIPGQAASGPVTVTDPDPSGVERFYRLVTPALP